MTVDNYLLGHRTAEQDRLQQQAEFLVDEANALFDQIGIAPGDRVVEIGCGPRGCLDLLAERVGPTPRSSASNQTPKLSREPAAMWSDEACATSKSSRPMAVVPACRPACSTW
jgi:hypothetical protein